jgi:hypothetical protein
MVSEMYKGNISKFCDHIRLRKTLEIPKRNIPMLKTMKESKATRYFDV